MRFEAVRRGLVDGLEYCTKIRRERIEESKGVHLFRRRPLRGAYRRYESDDRGRRRKRWTGVEDRKEERKDPDHDDDDHHHYRH